MYKGMINARSNYGQFYIKVIFGMFIYFRDGYKKIFSRKKSS